MLTHDVVTHNAIFRADEEAMSFEDGSRRTWRELELRSRQIGAALQELGVGQGDRVCVLAFNCMEMLELLVGCNRIGAVFAPINYRFAVPEIEYVLADCRPTVVVAQGAFAESIGRVASSSAAEGVHAWLSFDGEVPGARELEALLTGDPVLADVPVGPDDLSWICYTGGTTGESKGVMLSHRNNLAGANQFIVTSAITESSVYLVAGALFHIALLAPFAYWLMGGRVVIVNFVPGPTLDVMEREGVTHTVATGTILKMLVDEQELRPRANVRVRHMITGGAPLSSAMVRRARAAFEGCAVAHAFGMTESAMLATFLYPEQFLEGWRDDAPPEVVQRLKSVGRQLPFCQVAVVDDDGARVPIGEVGEVVLKGDNVMVGYWNKPELTEQTLEDGWLRTGDLGRLDQSGHLYLVDRKKDMVITGGENVYTSEVEIALSEHPAVGDVIVFGVPDTHWGERLHAVVVLREGQAAEPEEMRGFCRERLSDYKVPKVIEVRDDLPRLPTGKIAKGKIRAEYWAGHEVRVHGA
jgi:long-chain acyl-CoA synthetase